MSQLPVTAQFYLESKGKYILRREGKRTQKTRREARPWPDFDSSFYMFVLRPLGLTYLNWAS